MRWAWLSMLASSILQRDKAGHAPIWPRDYVPIPYLNSEARETDCFMGRHRRGSQRQQQWREGKQPLDVATAAPTVYGDSYWGRAEDRRKQAETVLLVAAERVVLRGKAVLSSPSVILSLFHCARGGGCAGRPRPSFMSQHLPTAQTSLRP